MLSSMQLLRANWDSYGGKRPEADRDLLLAFFAHRNHGPSDSMWGRCVNCGLTWEAEQRAVTLRSPKVNR